MDRYGYILTNENMETNIKGVYAAGDLRPKLLRQVVTAVADGAIAATDAERYVASEKERLGIIEEEVIEEKVENKNEVPTSNNKALSGRSNLLNDTLRNQLKGILSKIENNISLVSIVDESNKKSIELRDLVLDISDLSDKISAVIYKKGENLEMESKIHADKYPVVALLNKDSNYSGVKFHGVPGGHELNSFILAIYNLAGPGQALNEDLLNEIKSLSLDKKTNIKVAVSLSCHVCPEVVTAAQRIAIENPNIETEMLDLSNFKDIKDKHKIMSVPALIINDSKVYFGGKKLEDIVQLLK